MGSHETGKEGARILGAALAVAVLTTTGGCEAAVSATTTHEGRSMKDDIEVLHFKSHNFSASAYNTRGCKLLYAGEYQINESEGMTQPPPDRPDYREGWSGGVQVGIDNFPPPAAVDWVSLDGSRHHALVDIGAIFKDERVIHRVRKGEVKPNLLDVDIMPDIFIEVNDRTLRVFMQAHVGTKHLQDPSKPLSDFRDDLIEAWSKTY